MKNKKTVGLDKWKLYDNLLHVLQIAAKADIELYDVEEHHGYTLCYVPVYQRNKVYRYFERNEKLETTGMLGYLFRSLKKPSRVAGVLCAVLLWYGMSHMIYVIDIKGEDDESKQLIQKTLQDMKVVPPFYDKDIMSVKKDLKKKLEHKIAWLEIEKRGSKYRISYTPKEFAHIEELGHDELIAKEDGVIQRFDVLHGNKLHKVNEFVHKGDVLVSNVIDTSSNSKEELYVKGRVFAYTWKDISVEMKDDKMPKAFQYFTLLFQARNEISDRMRKDDRIYAENILQFSKEVGKIKMVIHYTLIQDITTP